MQEKTKVQEENPILVEEENKPILGFDETGDEKNLVMDESISKAPHLKSSSTYPHIEEIVEVQTQAQIDDVMEIQVHVRKVEAMKILPMEIISSLNSLYMPLESEMNKSKLDHEWWLSL